METKLTPKEAELTRVMLLSHSLQSLALGIMQDIRDVETEKVVWASIRDSASMQLQIMENGDETV